MEALKIERVTNANIYDAEANFLGRAEEVKLPEVKSIDTEHKGLGMVGRIDLPSGLDKMEMTIKWSSPNRDVILRHSNIFEYRQLQVRSEINQFGAQGRSGQEPLVIHVVARPKKRPRDWSSSSTTR